MEQALNWNRAATCAAPYPGVEEAMVEGLHALPADRGNDGRSTAERIFGIRALAAEMFGTSHPNRVIFTPGATYGLNVAVHSGIPDGAHVLTTATEHNSMLRPLAMAADRGVTFSILPFAEDGRLDLHALRLAIDKGDAQWLAIGMASNTMGIVHPFEEACAMAKEAGLKIVLDMAQGGGPIPVDLERLGVSYAAIAGHKSLHGPRGIGLLFVGADENPKPFLAGGTGTEATLLSMPTEFPGCLEAGTSNYPGIFGLGAALAYLKANPEDLTPIRTRLARLEAWCREQPGLEVLPKAPCSWDRRLAVLAIRPTHFSPAMMVQFLAQSGIDARAGSMCTSKVLPALEATEGLVRLSPPTDATDADFERVRLAIEASLLAFA